MSCLSNLFIVYCYLPLDHLQLLHNLKMNSPELHTILKLRLGQHWIEWYYDLPSLTVNTYVYIAFAFFCACITLLIHAESVIHQNLHNLFQKCHCPAQCSSHLFIWLFFLRCSSLPLSVLNFILKTTPFFKENSDYILPFDSSSLSPHPPPPRKNVNNEVSGSML